LTTTIERARYAELRATGRRHRERRDHDRAAKVVARCRGGRRNSGLDQFPATASAATDGNDQGNDEGNNEGLTGAWFVTALVNPSPPNPPAIVVVSFAGGGVYNDMLLNPLGVVSPALGTWELTGDHAFKATAWSTANLTPTLTVATRSHVEGTFGHDDIQATLKFEFFKLSDLMTTPLPPPIQTGTGSFSGTRITVPLGPSLATAM
jgi:hypothetical protein